MVNVIRMNAISLFRSTLLIALLMGGLRLPGQAQRVGIGTAQPHEALDVNGAVRLGTTTGTHTGTIRWNPLRNDFEGYTGTAWVSLTGSKGNWGRQDDLSSEDGGTTFLLTAHNNVRGKHLGSCLAVRDNALFVGAPDDYGPSGQVSAGSVRLVTRLSGRWKDYPDMDLYGPTPVANERFGASVAAAGNHLVIGATGANSLKGKIYLYDAEPGSPPTFRTSLVLADGANADYFGYAVGASSDFVLASAPFKDVGGQDAVGVVKAYKYWPGTASWLLYQSVNDPEPTEYGAFGRAISVSYPYAAIAAPAKTYSGLNKAGKVYLFHFNGASWWPIDTLIAPDPQAYDEFGYSVDLRGDTLVVGSPQFNNTSPDAVGKVYAYLRQGDQWNLHATLVNPDGMKWQDFGASVSTAEGWLVVGAPRAGIGLREDVGKVHVYAWTPGGLVRQVALSSDFASAGDQAGRSVVCRQGSIIVGAPYQDVSGYTDNGRLFYYYR